MNTLGVKDYKKNSLKGPQRELPEHFSQSTYGRTGLLGNMNDIYMNHDIFSSAGRQDGPTDHDLRGPPPRAHASDPPRGKGRRRRRGRARAPSELEVARTAQGLIDLQGVDGLVGWE